MAQDQAQSITQTPPILTNSPVVGSQANPRSGLSHPRPRFPSQFVDTPSDVEYRVVHAEELLQMFSEARPPRLDVGLLPNGMAYAPVARDQYLLFPTKTNFILYFTHYYFSRENLSKDQTFLSKMTNGYMPLATLVQAPRLRAIQATQDEVAHALAGSKVVCVEDMGGGVRGVCRRDRGTFNSVADQSSQIQTDGSFASTVAAPYPLLKPYPHVISTAVPLFESYPKVLNTMYSTPSEQLLSVADSGASNSLQSPLVPDLLVQGSSIPYSLPTEGDMTASCVQEDMSTTGSSSHTTMTNNVGISTWPNHHVGVTPVTSLVYPPGSTQSLVVEPTSIVLGGPFMNPQYSTTGVPNNFHPASDIPVVPLRLPTSISPCFVTSNVYGGYPTPSSGTQSNFTIAAVSLPNQNQAFVNTQLNGNILGNSPLTAFASSTPATALAAYAAAQQSGFIQPNASHSIPVSHGIFSTGQHNVPLYYMNQPLQFSLHAPRQRFAHVPFYPFPAYQYQPALIPHSIQNSPDFINHIGKVEPNGSASNNAQSSVNNMYPVLMPTHLPVHHANTLNYHINPFDTRLAMAATGLNIHRTPNRQAPHAFQHENSIATEHLPHAKVNTPVDKSVNNDNTEAIASSAATESAENVEVQHIAESESLAHSFSHSVNVRDKLMEERPTQHSSADSEDSTSSGIGEMNSACSSSAGDSRTLSSFTLTDQVTRSDVSPQNCKQSIPKMGYHKNVI